jgi:hypothetical protein
MMKVTKNRPLKIQQITAAEPGWLTRFTHNGDDGVYFAPVRLWAVLGDNESEIASYDPQAGFDRNVPGFAGNVHIDSLSAAERQRIEPADARRRLINQFGAGAAE